MMGRKKKVEEPEVQEEELSNGVAHEDPEDIFTGATVSVQVPVAETVGRVLETDEERQMFLTLISAFYSSEIVYEQLKMFVRVNMGEMKPPTELVVPEKKQLILPNR
jgi:hypothetical protein